MFLSAYVLMSFKSDFIELESWEEFLGFWVLMSFKCDVVDLLY